MTKRQVPETASRPRRPAPAGNRAPAQLAEQGASNEELIRRLQERTARIRQAIQQWRAQRQQVPGTAAQAYANTRQMPQPMAPNPFMAPPQAAMPQPGLPPIPKIPMMGR